MNKPTVGTRVIILTDGYDFEAWGSLSEICRKKSLSYNYLRTKKYPFVYRGIRFVRVPFRGDQDVMDFEKK